MDRPAPIHDLPDKDRQAIEKHAGSERIVLIADSFLRVTGKELIPAGADPANALWHAPMVVLAHGTQEDPVFFYGNRMALDLFEVTAAELTAMPSRYSAEPMERAERARFLAEVTERNFIADYSGIRISRSGNRFRIAQAIVWNLLDDDGPIRGQAACFDHWTPVS